MFFLQALFFDNPCQHPIVILKDTRWSELKAIVEYMYRGEISVAQEELQSLLRVAETLRIRGLSELNRDAPDAPDAPSSSDAAAKSRTSPLVVVPGTTGTSWSLHNNDDAATTPSTPSPRSNKRRRLSGGVDLVAAASSSPEAAADVVGHVTGPAGPMTAGHVTPTSQGRSDVTAPQGGAHDELDIKPGIAELIREEERVSFYLISLKLIDLS